MAPNDERPETSSNRRMAAAAESVDAIRIRILKRLEPYEDLPPVHVITELMRHDLAAGGSLASSALAFRLFLFLPPFVLFFVGVGGVVRGHINAASAAKSAGIVGSLASNIRAAFHQSGKTPWIMLGIGLFGVVWTGRSLGRLLVAVSCVAWDMPIARKAKFRDLGMIVGLCVCMGLAASFVQVMRAHFGAGAASASLAAVFGVYTVVWFTLSFLLPRRVEDPGALLPGAILFGLVLALLEGFSQLYLPSKLSRASQIYGTIGSAVVILGWFFIMGRLMVISMQLNAVVYDRFGSISRPIFALPVIRRLPQRSPKLRKFFSLDDEPDAAASGGAPTTETP